MKSTKNSIKTFFADTYALISIFLGHEEYVQYKSAQLITTQFQFAELHYYLLRNFNKEIADAYSDACTPLLRTLPLSSIKNAMRFRHKYKKRKLSYADATGYVYAVEHHIPFLTGDEEFKDFPNVAFVK